MVRPSRRYPVKRRLKLLDLFCGAGGASEGYSLAGLEVAVAVDNDEVAIASHRANHRSTEHIVMDLSKPEDLVSMFSRGQFDVVHGSPPCKNLSQANNKRDPEEGMRLVHAFEQLIQELAPKWWIMENVTPILKHLDGFYPKKRVFNAADFGVPQIRMRAFCGRFPDPRPTHSRVKASRQMMLMGCQLEPWVSVRQALGAPCVIDTGRDWRPDGYHQVRDGDQPTPALSTRTGGQFHMVLKHDREAPGGVERTRDLDEPSFALTGSPDLMLWTGGGSIHSDSNRANLRTIDEPSFVVNAKVPGRLMQPLEEVIQDQDLDGPARCVTATEDRWSPGSRGKNTRRRASGMLGRQLTPEECLILQGFRSDYWLVGTKTARYAQIGNAVPPPMARAIGLAIIEVNDK